MRLKLTARGRYSIVALLDLSARARDEPTSVNAIARRQQLPAPYLEKLLIAMRQAGLVRSLRGPQGGYQLARSPDRIYVGEILAAVGETAATVSHPDSHADGAEDWVAFTLWNRLRHNLEEALYRISLEDLYHDARSLQAARGQQASFVV